MGRSLRRSPGEALPLCTLEIDVVTRAEDEGYSAGALRRCLQAVLQIDAQGKGVGAVAVSSWGSFIQLLYLYIGLQCFGGKSWNMCLEL